MDVDLVRRLASAEGRALLRTLPPYEESRVLAVTTRLRADGHDPDLVSAALTQSRLRERARTKFGDDAAWLLFTQDGLEQATRPEVSARHTARFRAAGVQEVLDLGCGIGADALSNAAAGIRVRAVDSDPVTAAVAEANLAAHPQASVRQGLAQEVVLPTTPDPGTAAWFDPARRSTGARDARGRARRTSSLAEVTPSWAFVQGAAGVLGCTGAKFGPGFPRDRVPAGVEAEWVSFGGEALECTLWWGAAAHRPDRRGVALHDGRRWHELHERPAAGSADGGRVPGPQAAGTGPGVTPGSVVLDPDRAVLAAGLLQELATPLGLREIAPGAGYLVGQDLVSSPFARTLVVREVLPLHARTLRAWARAHDVGPLTLKKRGPAVDAEALRAQVRARGTQEATLLLTRAGSDADAPLVALWVSAPDPT